VIFLSRSCVVVFVGLNSTTDLQTVYLRSTARIYVLDKSLRGSNDDDDDDDGGGGGGSGGGVDDDPRNVVDMLDPRPRSQRNEIYEARNLSATRERTRSDIYGFFISGHAARNELMAFQHLRVRGASFG